MTASHTSVDINKILLEKIANLENENNSLKDEVSRLKGEKQTHGKIHRHHSLKPSSPLLLTTYEGAYTLGDVWKKAVQKFGDRKAMGYRVLKS